MKKILAISLSVLLLNTTSFASESGFTDADILLMSVLDVAKCVRVNEVERMAYTLERIEPTLKEEFLERVVEDTNNTALAHQAFGKILYRYRIRNPEISKNDKAKTKLAMLILNTNAEFCNIAEENQ